MLTATMNQPSCGHTPVRSSPFQARALYFLKKLALRSRGTFKKRGDAVSPVTIPTQDFRRAHSSLDLFRKPDLSRLIGFRAEDRSNPMDTDDSSQAASASSNSPHLRPRRHSTWDSLGTTPFHSTFAGHGPAPLFLRDQPGLSNKCLIHDCSGNVLAPAPLFLLSNTSLDAVVQPPRSPASNPEIPPQISPSPEPQPDDQGVQDTPDDVTPRPPEGDFFHNFTPTASLTDQAISTFSEQGMLSRTLTTEDFTSKTVHKRPPLLPRHTAPLPPPFRVTTERGLRLSPSIVTRQPMPLLNLPPLPPPPPRPDPVPRQNIPLRHMPSLSIYGRSNANSQADHENATLGDSDEEDGDGDECDEEENSNDTSSIHQSDDEDDEPPSTGPSYIPGSKSLQKRPMMDNRSPAEGPLSPILIEDDVDSSHPDYLRSETYVEPAYSAPLTTLEMYPFSANVASADDVNRWRTLDPDLSKPGVRLESRPGLYRVASRSMINLGSTRRVERGVSRVKSRETIHSSQGPTSVEGLAESEESDTEEVIGRLIRRTSMPSFHPTSDPPPYPTFNPRPKECRIMPREDEGRERLPTYSNSLYLIGIMPRKMEFSSPGVQAKDRKWRRVVCELEGTTFRMYKCPPGASGGGVLGDWWEKHVGVGDVASPEPPRTRKQEEQDERPAKLEIDDAATPMTPRAFSGRSTSVPPPRRRRESQSSMATQHTMMSTARRMKRTSGASFLSPFRSSSSIRPDASAGEPVRPPESGELELLPVDVQDSRSSSSQGSGRTTPVAQRLAQPAQPRSASRISFFPVATSRVQWRCDEVLKPPQSDLLHAYTLQHAESGLGNDYLKRKNVIRVRLEGEQFLLQAPDVPSVVEWIEGLHAGTNIALDIDQRPMPRGPMFPRRRRRRARRGPVEENSTSSSNFI